MIPLVDTVRFILDGSVMFLVMFSNDTITIGREFGDRIVSMAHVWRCTPHRCYTTIRGGLACPCGRTEFGYREDVLANLRADIMARSR